MHRVTLAHGWTEQEKDKDKGRSVDATGDLPEAPHGDVQQQVERAPKCSKEQCAVSDLQDAAAVSCLGDGPAVGDRAGIEARNARDAHGALLRPVAIPVQHVSNIGGDQGVGEARGQDDDALPGLDWVPAVVEAQAKHYVIVAHSLGPILSPRIARRVEGPLGQQRNEDLAVLLQTLVDPVHF